MTRLNKQERDIKSRFTIIENMGSSHRTCFVCGVQKFTVAKGDRASCRVIRECLAIALSNMLTELNGSK